MSRQRYLIVSDLHLCDIEEHPDGWKHYKNERFSYDADLAELLDTFVASRREGETLTFVLNGDIIDFDLVTAAPDEPPWPVTRAERRRGMDPTEPKSVWKLELVLAHHQQLVVALARFVAAGHQIVYVLGNHDRELHFPRVRQTFVDALVRAGQGEGLAVSPDAIRFEPWFHYVPGRIFIEHGQQYDHYSSFPNLLSPIVRDGAERNEPMLDLPMGNLSNRYLISVMGFFNPHSTNYILNAGRYAVHWLQHYAFTRRSLIFNWLWGSVLVLVDLLRHSKQTRARKKHHEAELAEVAKRQEIPLELVQALDALKHPPITDRLFRMIREFWIDRVIMAVLMTAGTVALALSPVPLWVKLMVPLTSFPLFYFIYEAIAQNESVFGVNDELRCSARRVAELVSTRVIAFGHTHIPEVVPMSFGVSFVNTGTWAPIFRTDDTDALEPGLRNFLIARFDGEEVSLELGSFMRRGAATDSPVGTGAAPSSRGSDP